MMAMIYNRQFKIHNNRWQDRIRLNLRNKMRQSNSNNQIIIMQAVMQTITMVEMETTTLPEQVVAVLHSSETWIV